MATEKLLNIGTCGEMKCIVGLMVICALVEARPGNSYLESKITGGEETENHQYPFQALIYFTNADGSVRFCGGVLTSEKNVVTAAHCVENAVNATVHLGVHSIAGMSRKQKIASRTFVKHPQWNKNTLQNNLAIVKLSQDAAYDEKVFKARLQCTNESLVGKNATVIGWGKESDNVSMARALRHVELEIVENRMCSDAYRMPILDNQLCQSTPNGKSSCDGDAGGAVVMNDGWGDVVIGIISFGCQVGMPIVHTNIYPYRDWIASATANRSSVITVWVG